MDLRPNIRWGDFPSSVLRWLTRLARFATDRFDAFIHRRMWNYETMPSDRGHLCHEVNINDIPIGWVEFDPLYGWQMIGTNVFGDGTYAEINHCPYCGKLLQDERAIENMYADRATKDRGIRITRN